MKILALDFSAMIRSAAVFDTESPELDPLRAGQRVAWAAPAQPAHPTTLAGRALAAAGISPESIDRLAIGLGPGSYTGIRMAIAFAQGWQWARPVEVIGVSSALCLAHQMKDRGHLGQLQIAMDAQRNEFCLAQYLITPTTVQEVAPMILIPAARLSAKVQAGEIVAGPDLSERFSGAIELNPDASCLARLGSESKKSISADRLQPIYLRLAQFARAPKPRPL
jgi:tRNA threonylcarbamoyladenosine biosynthesis protein TsaB